MESRQENQVTLGRLLRKVAPYLAPGLAALALLFALPSDSRSQTEVRRGKEKSEPPPVCGEWHRGAGQTSTLDLGEIKRSYEAMKANVTRALDRQRELALPDLARSYDAGLPACRGGATQKVAIPAAQGSRFRGKILYFVSASDLGSLELPEEIAKAPAAEILIMQAKHLKDLPEIARRLGRPVSLANAEFAKALGVRCANTWVKISEKGDELELHEVN